MSKIKCKFIIFLNYVICYFYAYMFDHIKAYIYYYFYNKKFNSKDCKSYFCSNTYKYNIIRQMKYCDYSNSFMIMFFMILPFSVIIAKCVSFYLCYNGFLIWLIIQTIFSCYMMFVLDDNASEYFSIFYRINILKKKRSFIWSLLILEILAWMICIYLFI